MRRCTVCAHPEIAKINEMIVAGASYRDISGQFNLSKSAVERHAKKHLPAALVKAKEASEVAQADSLLHRIEKLITQAEGLLTYGKSEKQGREWAAGLRELRKSLELLGRVSGELDDRPVVNIVALPQWVELRTVILQALVPYPEARETILEALSTKEEVSDDDRRGSN